MWAPSTGSLLFELDLVYIDDARYTQQLIAVSLTCVRLTFAAIFLQHVPQELFTEEAQAQASNRFPEDAPKLKLVWFYLRTHRRWNCDAEMMHHNSSSVAT